MIRKSLILAVAAAATLGASLLASTADARGFGPGAHANFSHGPSFSRGPGNFARFNHFNHFRPNFVWNHHHNWRWRYPRVWYRPIYTGYVGNTGYAAYSAPAAAPAANTCSCLTKQYTQDASGANIVVFKDVCTGELAMNPPVQGPVQQSQAQ